MNTKNKPTLLEEEIESLQADLDHYKKEREGLEIRALAVDEDSDQRAELDEAIDMVDSEIAALEEQIDELQNELCDYEEAMDRRYS